MTEKEEKEVDGYIAAVARLLMKGKARDISNDTVLKKWQIAGTHTELQVRRLG